MTPVSNSTATTPDTASFAALGVPPRLVKVLTAGGITAPFPIQADTLPDSLSGRDVLGRGKTGSGKTLAFAIPMVARLAEGTTAGAGRPRGLILAPTRELATQITAVVQPMAAALGLTVTTIFGGVPQGRQASALRGGVDIVVACPGRLEDLMRQRLVRLDRVEISVLDEADHMADLGFLPGVTRILTATPTGGQRLLFSATLDNGVDKLVKRFLDQPVMHSVDEATSHVSAMTHHIFEVSGQDSKKGVVFALASGRGRRILFMRTKHQARKLAKQLTDAGIPSVDLHGNLSQGARDRNLLAFSSGKARVLVATDVAARGVHVDDVELVVHVDPPTEHKAYLHRSGRTARAGSAGDVVTLTLPEQRRDMSQLLRKAAIKATPIKVTSDSEQLKALVGEPADLVAPPAVSNVPNRTAKAPGSSRSGGSRRPARPTANGSAPYEGRGRGQSARSEGGRAENGRSRGHTGGGGSRRTSTTSRTGSAR
ncbi:superfamily II DNA/RNA helicase [Williamsia limnetica]|jgi:superfamily II DNA/RNA helicase|uniref:Superfamily II DNA/RNA helicase n=1 Tax=Williamsia limnetica TaxID=882452 RepID=A0A318RWN8_WILLI|nr:DEAD/DEAH box helicase [Williamsia limnetica]PYE14286.1 superfamily II DNA/RNA helicase [Williamsia limnetica]